jgi:hypothetical protein
LPIPIERWTSRLRWFRGLDALLAWLTVLLGLTMLFPQVPPRTAMMLAAGLLFLVALIPRLRLAWRPVSGTTTVLVSRGLRPGDRAWFVHGRGADLVLVTARHGLRMVVARPGHDAAEGMSVRRTRVLLLPATA